MILKKFVVENLKSLGKYEQKLLPQNHGISLKFKEIKETLLKYLSLNFSPFNY